MTAHEHDTKRVRHAFALLALRNHPRCRHRSWRTGKPCRAPAMKNGCCRVHGGKALRGEEWGFPQLARIAHRPRKLARKLERLALYYEARERRLDSMPPVYRMIHTWTAHLPGPLRWARMMMAAPMINPETDIKVTRILEMSIERPVDYTSGPR